jgi:hypothetical protein
MYYSVMPNLAALFTEQSALVLRYGFTLTACVEDRGRLLAYKNEKNCI